MTDLVAGLRSTGARRLILLSGVVVSGTAVVIATHPDQARAVLSQLTRLPASALAAAFALIMVQLACQSLRLWAVVPRALGLGPGRVAHAWALGEWLNIFTPARTGDALKVVLIRRQPGAGLSGLPSATGAVLADKVVDLAALVLLCGAGGLIGLLWARAETGAFVAATVAALGLGLLVGLRLGGDGFRSRLRTWTTGFAGGFASLRDPVRGPVSLSFSIGAWVVEGCALGLLCAALGFALAPAQILLALVAVNIGTSVPISFANLGVYEASLAAGLSHVGVPLPTALAVATSHHGLQLLALNVGTAGLVLAALAAPLHQRARR